LSKTENGSVYSYVDALLDCKT